MNHEDFIIVCLTFSLAAAGRGKRINFFYFLKETLTKLVSGAKILSACSTSVNSSLFMRRVVVLPQIGRF